jgi:hypothetical protein
MVLIFFAGYPRQLAGEECTIKNEELIISKATEIQRLALILLGMPGE